MSDLPIVTTTKALNELMKEGHTDVTKGKHFSKIKSSPAVRKQYLMAEVAKKYLDEMEAAGRLHKQNQRSKT